MVSLSIIKLVLIAEFVSLGHALLFEVDYQWRSLILVNLDIKE